MIHIYSDAGTHKRTTVATAIFLTDTRYLGTCTKTYQDVESTTLGELLGIQQALEFARKHFPEETDLTIFTDSETIAIAYDRRLRGGPLEPHTKYFKTWKNVLALSRGKRIRVRHIKGHQTEHNPNKVCDMLSAALLQKLKQ